MEGDAEEVSMGRRYSRIPTSVLAVIALDVALSASSLLPPAITASAATSPQAIALTMSDVRAAFGSGFTESSAAVPNTSVALLEHISIATVTQHGRIGGYETSFQRAQTRSWNAVSLTNSIGAYRSSAGAHWQYAALAHLYRPPLHSRPIPLRGIGDESYGYLTSQPIAGTHFLSASLFLRRGAYNARLDVVALRSLPLSAVRHLARVLDARMQRAR
jgi:hypothetical protein